MINTWQDLATLRAQGKRPALRLIVTTSKKLCWGLHGVGCMTILHEPGKPMPLELLDGLDVLLLLGQCELAAKVNRAMRARGVKPDRCEAWCPCTQELTTCVGKCSDMAEIDQLLADA